VAGGQISPSPIDFHRRPFNTLALPCEGVIVVVVAAAVIKQRLTRYVLVIRMTNLCHCRESTVHLGPSPGPNASPGWGPCQHSVARSLNTLHGR